MPMEQGYEQEDDLDRTDRLPVLQGMTFDFDVEDDAVRLDDPGHREPAAHDASPGHYTEALYGSYERAQAAASAAAARAEALEQELSGARADLAVEQLRALRLQQSLAEAGAAVDLARSATDDALREAERHRVELRTLRDSLAARDATAVQVLNSLSERDAQLAALKADHAKLLPAIDARARSASQLEGELTAARSRLNALGAALKTEQETTTARTVEWRRSEAEVKTLRADLSAAAMQMAGYLEQLRTRDWRRGFDQNLSRERDGPVAAADLGSDVLKTERDRLQRQVAASEQQMTALRADVADRDRALTEARAASETETRRAAAVAASLEQVKSQHAASIAEYEAAAETHDQELNVLIVHLQEARRPVEAIVGDVRRLKDELLTKDAACEALAKELQESRAQLEQTRVALQERELLIRRLERSETNNATALGRIQNSVERLGSAVERPLASPAEQEASAELIRTGDSRMAYALGRRTRIGRAPSCELQIDAASVSRYHALIILSGNEAIIEDLNSTNGVMVNGRKVTRQTVTDGDVVTIGDIAFKFALKPPPTYAAA